MVDLCRPEGIPVVRQVGSAIGYEAGASAVDVRISEVFSWARESTAEYFIAFLNRATKVLSRKNQLSSWLFATGRGGKACCLHFHRKRWGGRPPAASNVAR